MGRAGEHRAPLRFRARGADADLLYSTISPLRSRWLAWDKRTQSPLKTAARFRYVSILLQRLTDSPCSPLFLYDIMLPVIALLLGKRKEKP